MLKKRPTVLFLTRKSAYLGKTDLRQGPVFRGQNMCATLSSFSNYTQFNWNQYFSKSAIHSSVYTTLSAHIVFPKFCYTSEIMSEHMNSVKTFYLFQYFPNIFCLAHPWIWIKRLSPLQCCILPPTLKCDCSLRCRSWHPSVSCVSIIIESVQ